MIRLETVYKGHPQIAKQMMAHLPGKTAKQIRDKRKEPSYKALVEEHYAIHQELQQTVEQDPDESDEVARLCESDPGGVVPALRSGTPPEEPPNIERIPRLEGAAGAAALRTLARTAGLTRLAPSTGSETKRGLRAQLPQSEPHILAMTTLKRHRRRLPRMGNVTPPHRGQSSGVRM